MQAKENQVLSLERESKKAIEDSTLERDRALVKE